MKSWWIILLSFGSFSSVFAQFPDNVHRCYQQELTNEILRNDPALQFQLEQQELALQNWIANQRKSKYLSEIITIPVVFHVLYFNDTQNIPDEQIWAQLEALNRDFRRNNPDSIATPSRFKPIAADTEIEFCMAQQTPDGSPTNGIIRKQVFETNIGTTKNYYQPTKGGTQIWDPRYYMNVWVCDISDSILGFTYLPGTAQPNFDGIVLHYRVCANGLPAKPPYDKGRTLVHEVGHWLNLQHPWGPEEGCDFDDGVADTPLQEKPNSKCPNWPISCNNGPEGDMYVNYMDYTYDNCQNAFSTGQKQRMQATLQTTRKLLQSSIGCAFPDTTQPFSELVEVFPVPAQDYVTIKFQLADESPVQIECYSLDGKLIDISNISIKEDRYFYDITSFSKGNYVLRITTPSNTYTFPIIKIQ
jgi:hypothetical protein